MTGDRHDENREFELGRRLHAMENLYNKALGSDVTELGLTWLFRAHLLLRIADHDIPAAGEAIRTAGGRRAARQEFEQLTEAERTDLRDEIGTVWPMWVKTAIERLWHAAEELDIDTGSLHPDHVALTAATMLSPKSGMCPRPTRPRDRGVSPGRGLGAGVFSPPKEQECSANGGWSSVNAPSPRRRPAPPPDWALRRPALGQGARRRGTRGRPAAAGIAPAVPMPDTSLVPGVAWDASADGSGKRPPRRATVIGSYRREVERDGARA